MGGGYGWPFDTPFAFGTEYGKKGSAWRVGYHSGQDFISGAAGGDGVVRAVADGRVIRRSFSASYGNFITLEHDDGYLSLYAHLRRYNVSAGQRVSRGEEIGSEGSTGNSTGPHLHLEIHYKNYHYPASIDPRSFIEANLEVDKMVDYMRLPRIHSVRIPIENFRVIPWGKGKRTAEIKNYACFPFQASGKVAVGNIVASGKWIARDSRLTTIWVTDTGVVDVGKTPPANVKHAVSGIPLIVKGRITTLAEALADGWDTSPFYATSHAMLAIGNDGALHYYVLDTTSKTAAATFSELQNIAVMLGAHTVILGDGGGSTIIDIDGRNVVASGGNRVLAALIGY